MAARLAVLALLASAATLVHGRACEDSDMCSLGISKQWVGDIKNSSRLRSMLEAVTFHRELIIVIYQRQQDAPYIWLDQVMQLHYELQSMGYAHHVFVAHDEQGCDEIQAPDLSCVWDSSPLPTAVFQARETALWHQRWKLLARAVRLGYNVMSVDSDFIFFQDPYVHFKHPPFSDIQLLCNPEGGSAFNCNGGFIYVRNARPDGPVAWVFMEVVRSSLRRGDDNFTFLSQWTGHHTNCLTFDQSLISDALCTAAVGRTVQPSALQYCKGSATFTTPTGKQLTFATVQNNVNTLVKSWERVQRLKVFPDSGWLARAGFATLPDDDTSMVMTRLTVPNMAYGIPEALGGRTWPNTTDQPLSGAWEAMLRADCPDCPWWPEERPIEKDPLEEVLGPGLDTPNVPASKLDLFRDPEVVQELYGQSPHWLSCSLSNARRGVMTGPGAPYPGYIVMGHVHSWHMQTSRVHKTMIRKVFGRYNWTLGMEWVAKAGAASPYLMARNVTRVLALSPGLDLSRTRSWAEFASIMAGLFQVAHLSRRTVLLPDVPCQASWLHAEDTLQDPDRAGQVCLPPTFWGADKFRFPLPVTIPVDQWGQLVGANGRRQLHGTAVNGARDGNGQTRRSALGTATQGGGRRLAAAVGGSRRTESQRRAVQEGDAGAADADPQAWWRRQRYVAALPQLWDASCTLGMHALISSEFHHWRAVHHGDALNLAADDANTVLRPAPSQPGLQLQPPSPPGGDAAAVPAGEVVSPSPELGWSLRDVQAAVPARDVITALHAVADKPLVYLGHPVMVVPSTSPGPQGEPGDLHAHTEPGFLHAGATFHSLPPDEALQRVNEHLRGCKCKALWEAPESHRGTVVDLTHGHPAVLDPAGLLKLQETAAAAVPSPQ